MTIPRIFRILLLASSIPSITLSIIYIVILLYPQIFLTGYVYGYISLINYEIRYDTNGKLIKLPNLDTVQIVSLTMAIHTAVILSSIIIGLLMIKRKPITSTSTIYGASLSLIIASGILRYLIQAFTVDVGVLMQYANKGPFRFKTLAGSIEYPGIYAERTIANTLISIYPWLIELLLYTSSTLSIAAMIWAAWSYGSRTLQSIEDNRYTAIHRLSRYKPHHIQALSSITLAAIILYTGASIFTYHPLSASIHPTPPPITLDYPPYTYTLNRIGRVAVAYTDFETYPVPGWASYGGIWGTDIIQDGKGRVLWGNDNNRGLGRTSQYYYNVNLSSYTSLWIAAKVRYRTGPGYYGVSMMDDGRSRMYTVEVSRDGYIAIRSYNVEATGGWRILVSKTIPGYSPTSWYIIIVNYTVTSISVNITARIYDTIGSLIASTSTSSTHTSRFTPAYIGVQVDLTQAYFDDFLIATSDPRYLYFSGLDTGMSVEVWDNLGNLVSSTIAVGDPTLANIVYDTVIGTGSDGRIVVKLPDGSICIDYHTPSTDAILGGDTYRIDKTPTIIKVTLGANRTSATISANISANPYKPTITYFIRIVNTDTKIYYTRLILNPSSSIDQLTANISLTSGTIATAKNITIVNGVVISDTTDRIAVEPGIDVYAALSAYIPDIGRTAILYILLEYSTPLYEQSVHVYYPIELKLKT